MLYFRYKLDTNYSDVDISGLDSVTIIAYRDLLLTVDNKKPLNALLSQLRIIFGSPTGKLKDAVKFKLLDPVDIFYRIPFTDTYINLEYNRITLKSASYAPIPIFTMPIALDKEKFEIKLELRHEPEDTFDLFIGTHKLIDLYRFARYFIHIPKIFANEETKPRVQAWYSKIRFVTRNRIEHPILVGDNVLFADYTSNDTGHRIELGISPEYPTVLIKKCTPAEPGETGKLILSKYAWLYKYLEFSYSLQSDFCLTGYIAFDNEITRYGMIHLPICTFGRNLEGKDPIYMIASAVVGGRTEKKCCLSVDKLDKNKIFWVEADNLYGPDSSILDYQDEYMSKIQRS